MDTNNGSLFDLGLVVASAQAALSLAKSKTQPEQLLNRHANLDFGEVDEADRQTNLDAIKSGGRVRSAYLLPTGEVVLVVTDQGSTTLLAPPELDQSWG